MVLPRNGLTCSDSILAFLISSRLFEIGILSSPSLFLSAPVFDCDRCSPGRGTGYEQMRHGCRGRRVWVG